MPRHFEKRELAYTPHQIYDLVADVGRYPEFLPWCLDARVYDETVKEMKADLVVGNGLFQDRFTSLVSLQRPEVIQVRYGGGALSHLENEWRFKPVNGTACEVSFFVDFRVRSRVLGVLMDAFFEKAFGRMVQAFETRAGQLYGEQKT